MVERSAEQKVSVLIDEFLSDYERAWGNIYSQDRLKAFRLDVSHLRLKLKQALSEEAK
jgi:hypothetical protein